MPRRLASILCIVLVLVGVSVGVAGADNHRWVPVFAEPFDGVTVPADMVVVFVRPDSEGLYDGGPPPEGFVVALGRPLPDGFSDGGDVPEGFVEVLAQFPGPEFWLHDIVPEGLLAVLAWPPPDGFSDGGDRMGRWEPVLLGSSEGRAPEP